MKPVETHHLQSEVRDALQNFWRETLEVEATASGVLAALPLSYPDGSQVVLEIEPLGASSAKISDQGRTLAQLFMAGVNYQSATSRTRILMEERLAAFEIQRADMDLIRQIGLPVQALDLHLFGEALVSIAHLFYRRDPSSPRASAARKSVEGVLLKAPARMQKNRKLLGETRHPVAVDYYLELHSPLAVQVIERKRNVFPYMEQWGWRWKNLERRNPNLLCAMVYDPAKKIDSDSIEIGRRVCDVFCAYDDVEQLDELVARATDG